MYILLPICIGKAHAQLPIESSGDLSAIVEQVLMFKEDQSYDEVHERLLQLSLSPLDVNAVDEEKLRGIGVLTEKQIQNLLEHRRISGPMISFYELQAVEGFDEQTIRFLMPFLRFADRDHYDWKGLGKRMLSEKNNFLLMRSDGLVTRNNGDRVFGSPMRSLMRFRSQHPRDYSLNFTAERDAGEQFIWNPGRGYTGFDFTSVSLRIMDKGRVQNLIIGDYNAGFGQGLVLGSGFGVGKGAETITSVRQGYSGFRPYTSLNESGFFRGIAASFLVNKYVSMDAFYSLVKRDGDKRMAADSSYYIHSLLITGLHRSENELANRKNLKEGNAGVALRFRARSTEAGLLLSEQKFSTPLSPPKHLYSSTSLRGRHFQYASIFINSRWQNISFFSEASLYQMQSLAWIAGLQSALTPEIDFSALVRSYPGTNRNQSWGAMYSKAFSENSDTGNEQGLYMGFRFKPDKKKVFSAYVDLFRFPLIKYRVYKPSDGSEWLMKYTQKFSGGQNLSIQIRQEKKLRNVISDGQSFYNLDETTRTVLAFVWHEQISHHFSSDTRIQASGFKEGQASSAGWFVAQDFDLKYPRWSISTRYGIFDSRDYDARIFTYERDLWLAYAFPSFYGRGVRCYANVKWSPGSRTDFYVRWAGTYYRTVSPKEDPAYDQESWRLQLVIKL